MQITRYINRICARSEINVIYQENGQLCAHKEATLRCYKSISELNDNLDHVMKDCFSMRTISILSPEGWIDGGVTCKMELSVTDSLCGQYMIIHTLLSIVIPSLGSVWLQSYSLMKNPILLKWIAFWSHEKARVNMIWLSIPYMIWTLCTQYCKAECFKLQLYDICGSGASGRSTGSCWSIIK